MAEGADGGGGGESGVGGRLYETDPTLSIPKAKLYLTR